MVDTTNTEGLGLAEAAGLNEEVAEAGFDFIAQFWHYFQNDLISSIPITICSFLLLAVIIERSLYYNRNNRDISVFIHNLQVQLEKGNLEAAQNQATRLHSVIGEVAEEGVRLLAVQKEDFSRAYDITTNIVVRKLQKYLPILGTIGAIAPFLGLFGTVSGVIKSLFKMGQGGEAASLTMIAEISNALIATGYGLAIAIIAVVAYNLFGNIVKRYEDDFMLLKLLFLSFSNIEFDTSKYFGSVFSDDSSQGLGQNLDYSSEPNMAAAQQASVENLNPAPEAGEKPPYPDFLR